MRLPGLALELQSVPHGGQGNSLRDWTSAAAPGKSDPGCNAFPDPQTKDSSHWRSSGGRGHPGGFTGWVRKKTVKEVRLSRKTLSQTRQVSKSSPLTEPVFWWT